jgi:hypothetical protein
MVDERKDGNPLVEQLKGIPLIGETIPMSRGQVLQTPHPKIINALQGIDPRVRYFPMDREKAEAVGGGMSIIEE